MALLLFAFGSMIACQKSTPTLDSQSKDATQPGAPIDGPAAASIVPVAASALVAMPVEHDLCRELCAASAPLHCPASAECAPHCRQMMSIPACRGEMLTTLRCFAKQPVQNWECDSDGLPSIKQGFCDPEQEKFTNCMQQE